MTTTTAADSRPSTPSTPSAQGAQVAQVAPSAQGEPPPLEQPRAGLRGARTGRPRALWLLAAVLAATAIAVAATLGRSAWEDHRDAATRAEALAAGRQLAVNFVTLDAKTFDVDTARVVAGATGEFKKQYESTLAQLKPVVEANRSVSTVERAEAAFVSGDDDSAQVIVGIVAPTTNTATPKPEKKTYRLRLGLEKTGDTWKVSSLDFVG